MSSPNAQVTNLHSRPPMLACVLACAPSFCLAWKEVAEKEEMCVCGGASTGMEQMQTLGISQLVTRCLCDDESHAGQSPTDDD
jgi:hypothetical protein